MGLWVPSSPLLDHPKLLRGNVSRRRHLNPPGTWYLLRINLPPLLSCLALFPFGRQFGASAPSIGTREASTRRFFHRFKRLRWTCGSCLFHLGDFWKRASRIDDSRPFRCVNLLSRREELLDSRLKWSGMVWPFLAQVNSFSFFIFGIKLEVNVCVQWINAKVEWWKRKEEETRVSTLNYLAEIYE